MRTDADCGDNVGASPNVNTTMNEQYDALLPKVIAVTAVMLFVKSLAPLGLSLIWVA